MGDPFLQSDLCFTLLDQHPNETLCVDLDGRISYANRSAGELLGSDEDVTGRNFFDLFGEPRERVKALIERSAGSNSWQPMSLTLISGDQSGLRLALRCRGLRNSKENRIQALIVSDEGRMTKFKEHRKLIRQLNTELAEQRRVRIRLDEALANESRLHQELIHRVKNNLTLLSSLIRSRALAADDDAVQSALDEVRARVMSIALVHDVLDQSKSIDIVNTHELLEKLCKQMETSICPPGVTINCDFTPYKLHVSEATPLALMVNELVTNSLKHAFKGADGGQVDVALKRNGVDKIEVHVADNGAGFDEANANRGSGSKIVRALAQQLHGELSVKSDDGTAWQLIFAPTDIPQDDVKH